MNLNNPIQIADDIYWIGYAIKNDPFQCHVYLIKNGEESVLIDPGGLITFPEVLEKLISLISLKDIKYIIMHHQDPDIVACYSTLEKIMPKRDDRYIVTHWRTEMLLNHYNWATPFYLIDENNWILELSNRKLEFVFTPYAHFAGAFCTYDTKTGVLFSSDLFGGLTEKFSLYATDLDTYFEQAKPFHKHYIPSKEVLGYALTQIEKKKPSLIAPQHGSIIENNMINPLINKLKNLDCGLYLLEEYESDLYILNKTDSLLQQFLHDTVSLNSFYLVLQNLYRNIKQIINSLEDINISIMSPFSNKEHLFSFNDSCTKHIQSIDTKENVYKYDLIQKSKKIGKVFIQFKEKLQKKDKSMLDILFHKISVPMAVALEKELLLEELEAQNKSLHKKAMLDSLTHLYNRFYMEEYLKIKLKELKRYNFPISIAIFDIDFFKKINDKYGHIMGDCVLKELSQLFHDNFRTTDVIVRYGGEEIIVIMPFVDLEYGYKKIDKFRRLVEKYEFCKKYSIHITISGGIIEVNKDNIISIKELIEVVDKKLYYAKKNGRNKICK